MTDTPPIPIDELLSHRRLGRVLQAGQLSTEFALIRKAWSEGDKPLPVPNDFARVGRGSGTHLLKLVSPRASTSENVLRFRAAGANRQPDLVPSLDAKMARVAKIVFRPLEVAGHPVRHLADHILNPDDLSPSVLEGFADAFGKETLVALRNALTELLPPITRLPHAEFPIIFLPRPGGGDLQATPLAPAGAYVRMSEVTAPFRFKQSTDHPAPRRGRWHRQHVSGKPQNISGAVGPRRTRFMATMPRLLDRLDAEIHRYVLGGGFPLWRDEGVAAEVERYADLVDRQASYSNQDIRRGADRRADVLIGAARAFVDEVMADARSSHPDASLPPPPSLANVILRRRWKGDGADRARRVLTGEHFRARLG